MSAADTLASLHPRVRWELSEEIKDFEGASPVYVVNRLTKLLMWHMLAWPDACRVARHIVYERGLRVG